MQRSSSDERNELLSQHRTRPGRGRYWDLKPLSLSWRDLPMIVMALAGFEVAIGTLVLLACTGRRCSDVTFFQAVTIVVIILGTLTMPWYLRLWRNSKRRATLLLVMAYGVAILASAAVLLRS